jgi:hypothetical protein
VGAICLRGVDSQYDLMGALHCDYHEDVNKKLPNKQPQSILLALDPFNLLYESNMGTGGLMDWKVDELLVNRGQAVFFLVLFVMLVVQITPSIKQDRYIVYLRILFWRQQIILPKLEQGSDIEV